MTLIHLSDTEIQLYSLDKDNCGLSITEHISHCGSCAAKAKNYTLLFLAVEDAPKPVIDFDITSMVLTALPGYKKSPTLSDRFVYFISFAAISFLGILTWFLQKDLTVIFDGVASMAMYVLLIPIVAILIWEFYDLYEKYKRKMSVLN